mmetsp:Transcript_29030/g.32563  ORF Transcript_29030/g.32563 Transcript_29030/m.32563 type:complete len:201 (-) Transcript_29030:1137-1739(-)
MKLKKKTVTHGIWSSLLFAVVRNYSTCLVLLLGGNPDRVVVAFLPIPVSASSSKMHDAPRRRSNNNTVGRTGSFHFRRPTPLWQGRRQRRDGGGWDGDDVRVWTRLRRKLRRRLWLSSSLTGPRRRSAAQSTVLALQLIVYFCQIATTIIALQRQFPSYWQTPRYACGMVIDAITGSTVVAHSPVVRAFGFRATIATSST